MTETKETPVKKEPAKKKKRTPEEIKADWLIALEFGDLSLDKLRSRKGKFKKDKQKRLDELTKLMEKIEGKEAKKTQTIFHKGLKLTVIKGFNVPQDFVDTFSKEQVKQYFK